PLAPQTLSASTRRSASALASAPSANGLAARRSRSSAALARDARGCPFVGERLSPLRARATRPRGECSRSREPVAGGSRLARPARQGPAGRDTRLAAREVGPDRADTRPALLPSESPRCTGTLPPTPRRSSHPPPPPQPHPP